MSTGPTEALQTRFARISSNRKIAPASTCSSVTIFPSASRTVAVMSWVWAKDRLSDAANSSGSVSVPVVSIGWLAGLDMTDQPGHAAAKGPYE